MKRTWTPEELLEHFILLPGELDAVGNKSGATRLGFAILFKCFQYEGRFLRSRQEAAPEVVRYLYFGQKGEVRQRYREGQEEQLGALGLVVNAMVLWNTLYMNEVLEDMRARGMTILPEDVERFSPLGYDHINLLGRYTFNLSEEIRQGALRPLREVEDLEEAEQAKEPIAINAEIQKEA